MRGQDETMNRSTNIDHDYQVTRFWDDELALEQLIDSMEEPLPVRRRPKREYLAHKRINDLQEERWFRRQIRDWDTDGTS